MNLGLNASQLQFLAEVVVQPLKQAGATVYLFGSRARGTAAPALLTKAREHLQQGELKAAAELYQQIALDDHLWPERLTDTIRYHLLNKRPLEAWRLTELARRVGTHLDDLSYYRALTGCTKTPDMSEVLSHLGAVVMMFGHFYAVVVVKAGVDDQLTSHLIELSTLICRV